MIVFSRVCKTQDTQTPIFPYDSSEPNLNQAAASTQTTTITKYIQTENEKPVSSQSHIRTSLNRHKSAQNREQLVFSSLLRPTHLAGYDSTKPCKLRNILNLLSNPSISSNPNTTMTRSFSKQSSRNPLNRNFHFRKLSKNVLSRIRSESRPKRRLKIID